MRRRIGRRARFFAVTMLVCLALVSATPPEFRWVAWASSALAGFWAVLFAVEDLIGKMSPEDRVQPSDRPREPEAPFAPPPPPTRPTR